MKKIVCIVRAGKLEDVKDALNKSGVKSMTVTQVMWCGLQKGRKEVYRETELTINLLPKVKVEVVVADKHVDQLVDVNREAAMTGNVGDGKIFIYSVENAIRIRTGESRDEAI